MRVMVMLLAVPVCRRLSIAAFALVALALVSGCGHGGLESTARASHALTSAASVYVAVPADGRSGTRTYAGSGVVAAQAIVDAFARRRIFVERATEKQPPAAALAAARERGATYLVSPVILRWEDRSTAWSGVPDAVAVRVAVVETRSGDAADISIVRPIVRQQGPSDDDAGTRPEDILDAALERYVDRLMFENAAVLQAGRQSR